MPINLDRHPHARIDRVLSGTSLVALLAVGAAGALTPTAALAQAATYLTQPSSGGPPNTAASITAGTSIAVGVAAHSSSPVTDSGDSIAIGSYVNATQQDTIAIGAETNASAENAIAIGNGVVDPGAVGIGGGFTIGSGGLLTTASGVSSIAFGDNSTSSGTGSVTFGNYSIASGNGALALGNLTTASSIGGVALGYGSVAGRAASNFTEPFSAAAVTSPYGAVSIGAAGFERQITNVAGGTAATDAVNLRQLRGLGTTLATSLGGGAGFNANTNAYTAPTYTIGGTAYNSVAGAFTAISGLSVQYTPDGSGNPTNTIDLTRGGGLGAVSLTGLAPATTGSGAVSLSQLPLQYSTAGAPTTANPAVTSNDVTLVGSGGQPVALHNVAPGALTATSTDATTGSQLYTTNQNEAADATNIAGLRGSLTSGSIGLVQQTTSAAPITVGAATGGASVNLSNNAGATRALTGVSAGRLSATSTDAVSGSQLYTTNQNEATDAATIAGLRGSLSGGSIGLVQQTAATAPITVGAATGGTSVNLTNNAGAARTLTGVSAGTLSATSTDVVVGSQLYATNQTVAGLAGGTLGLVKQDQTTRAISVGSGTDGTLVSLANQSGAARTLTGVTGGLIAKGSTDVVNGSQVASLAASAARNFGGGAVVNADGTVSVPSYSVLGSTYSDVGGAIGGLNTAVQNIDTNGTRYVAVHTTGAAASATGADTVAIGPAASASADGGVALGANAVALRAGLNGAQEAFTGLSVASTAGAVSVGDVGAERQITNVAGGTADTDAVNVRQLTAVGSGLAAALGGGAALQSDGTLQAPTYSVGGTQYASVGGALTALDSTGVKYDVDPTTGARGNSITLAGGDPSQPVLIRNVATGVAATDAANTGQVAAAKASAFAYTDQSIGKVEQQMGGLGNQVASLQTDVGHARTEARQGAAIGLAAASLRFDDRPGKLSTAVGAGVWKGQEATAFGIGYSLPDGWARLNATGVTTGRDFGFAAGASFTLN